MLNCTLHITWTSYNWEDQIILCHLVKYWRDFEFLRRRLLDPVYINRRTLLHQILDNDEFLSRDILLFGRHGIFQQKFSCQSRLNPLTWQRSIVVEICKLCWTTCKSISYHETAVFHIRVRHIALQFCLKRDTKLVRNKLKLNIIFWLCLALKI